MAELNSNAIERIVVRGVNWVGDAVMTIPALRQIRRLFPNAHVTLATRPWAKGLFSGAEFLDDLLVHEGSGLRSVVQQVRQWRKRNFDLAVLLPNSLETALVASLARVPLRIGYATDGRQSLLGIFSATQIARQLGVQIQTHEMARTFAEIEAVIAGV